MVERFNGRINELLQQTRFDSRADLRVTLMNYLKLYHHHIPQRALDAKPSILALEEWHQKRTELFVKCVLLSNRARQLGSTNAAEIAKRQQQRFLN